MMSSIMTYSIVMSSIVSWTPPLSDTSPSQRRCRGRPADSGDQLFLWLASSGIDRIVDPTRLTKDFYSKSNSQSSFADYPSADPFSGNILGHCVSLLALYSAAAN
jgi:hypothetical protein